MKISIAHDFPPSSGGREGCLVAASPDARIRFKVNATRAEWHSSGAERKD